MKDLTKMEARLAAAKARADRQQDAVALERAAQEKAARAARAAALPAALAMLPPAMREEVERAILENMAPRQRAALARVTGGADGAAPKAVEATAEEEKPVARTEEAHGAATEEAPAPKAARRGGEAGA